MCQINERRECQWIDLQTSLFFAVTCSSLTQAVKNFKGKKLHLSVTGIYLYIYADKT